MKHKLYGILFLVLLFSLLTTGVQVKADPPVVSGGEAATEDVASEPLPGNGDSGPVDVVVVPDDGALIPTDLLYDNGSFVNCTGCGVGGANESVLQDLSLGMNTLGFGHQVSTGYRVADEFTITDAQGWEIDTITFYAYQTGSTTASTITAVNLRIWDGIPGAGGTVVWGNTTTNLLSGTGWASAYRVSQTTSGVNTERPIMANIVDLGGLLLAPGTYWLDWQADGTLASGPWAVPITINGQATTGNGRQYTGSWAAALDSGTNTQQGFPFRIQGQVVSSPPDPPSGLVATAVSATQINLTWQDNSSDETAFHIERSPNGATWTEIGTVSANTISYNDTGLTCNTTYHYRVRAYRAGDDVYSDYSNASMDTTGLCALAAPSGLVATAVSATEINLTWQDNSIDESAFHIERSPNGATSWSEVITTAANIIDTSDINLDCNTTYFYRIRGYREDDEHYSEYSNVGNATTTACGLQAFLPYLSTPGVPPAAAPLLNPIDNPDGRNGYTASWNQVDLATSYTLEESRNVDFANTNVVYTGSGTSTTASVSDVGTYYYRVRAENAYGNSDWSNIVSTEVTQLAVVPLAGYWSGSNVALEVSADSTIVAWFELRNIYVYGCGYYTLRWEDMPITGGQFSKGEFTSPTSAGGVASFFFQSCNGYTLGSRSWSATWQHTQIMHKTQAEGYLIFMSEAEE